MVTTAKFIATLLRLLCSRHDSVEAGLAKLRQVREARQSRAAIERLLNHQDWQLRDIGVSRRDIEMALSVSWDENPSVALAEMRRRRMRADRQALVQRPEQ